MDGSEASRKLYYSIVGHDLRKLIMDQKQQLSKTATLITGIVFVAIGALTVFMGLNLTGSILLIVIGLIGIIASIIGAFESEKR